MREIKALTALRGIAALWVVLYHYAVRFTDVPGGFIIGQGDLAVDVFFTLSGFILVYVYRDGCTLKTFLARRFARLYPVHLVTLIAMALLILGADWAGMQVNDSSSAVAFAANLFGVHGWGVLNGLTYNYPSWSISAEFAAYLAFPFLVGPVLRRPLPVVVGLTVGFFVFCVWLAEATGRPLVLRTYDVSVLRILPEFLVGMVTARIVLERKVPHWPCAVIGVGLLVWGLATTTPLGVVGAVPFLIAGLFLYDWQVPSALRYLGLVSYSLYMVHALIEKFGFRLLEHLLGTQVLPLWSFAVVVFAALLAAIAMYHLVEEPGRKWVLACLKSQRGSLKDASPGKVERRSGRTR